MFTNINTKKRMIINMLISQIGFATISITTILAASDLVAIIAVNIIFALVVAYTNLAVMKRIVGGVERLDKYFMDIMDFMFYRTNRVQKAEYIKKDEIGFVLAQMNSHFEHIDETRKKDMKVLGEIILSLDKIQKGIFHCKVKSTTENFMIRTLAKTVNTMIDSLEKNMTDVKDRLKEYTDDNYKNSVTIDKKITHELREVMESVNILRNTLSTNAQNNLENGELLSRNSDYMTSSMDILAKKANQQAASLEETAAALEEITSLTRNNAENANKMADLGETVKKSVKNGQVLASQTATSMDEINEHVNAINEAITIIDQIAFQTNILSLNAAVEAATAGEAGKGFAVVAQEVRNLASRSAEAAKEIKDLVENATTKANDGKIISDNMIKGYDELNTHISGTIDIIDDVSSASKEQMSGIEQINFTVTSLDKATQENASEAGNVSELSKEIQELATKLVIEAKMKQF